MKALKWLAANFLELVACIAMVVAVSVTAFNSLSRYIFDYTFAGSSEVVALAFVWVIFPATAASYHKKMHYGIDLIVDRLPEKLQNIANLITSVLSLVIMCVCMWLALVLIAKVGAKFMPVTNISYFWYDLPAVIAFIYMAGSAALSIVEDIQKMRKGDA